MISANDASGFAATSSILDTNDLAALKRQARAGDPASNKAVAKQFEALFLQMVLKSMRAATPREGLLDSEPGRLYESLLDQQLSLTLGGGKRGLGLAEMIEKQMARQGQAEPVPLGPLPLQRSPQAFPFTGERALPLRNETAPPPRALPGLPLPQGAVAPAVPTSAARPATAAQRAFVERLMPAALAAEQSTGIPAHFMVAQAALETGWGKAEPVRSDGSSSFNIFGIKAGANWSGPVVEAATTEVIAGLAQTRVERFRAYASHQEAFRDYANLLASSPRYAKVLGAQDADRFARGLQAAGYATDPQYAQKLEAVIGSAALRQALAG